MGQFWTNLNLVMAAMVFTTSMGFSITRQNRNGATSNDSPLGQLFRSTREVRDGNGDISVSEDSDMINATLMADPFRGPCSAYSDCMMPGRTAVRSLMAFHLGSASQLLDQQCPNLEGSEDCDVGQCKGSYFANHIALTSLIMDWSCERLDDFHNGAPCWGNQLTLGMMGCVETYEPDSPHSSVMEQMIECFANVPENLSVCSEEDADFVRSYVTAVITFGREVYPE